MTNFARKADWVNSLSWQTIQAGLWNDQDIDNLCRDIGITFRRRMLTPAVTLKIWILQILFDNTAITDLRHKLDDLDFNPSAYCQARQRIPVSLIRSLVTLCAKRFAQKTPFVRSLGPYRVFHVDGTGLSMPDRPKLAERFGKPCGKRRVGFPVMHALVLMDTATGYLMGAVYDRWNTHDLRHTQALHPLLRANDLLVGDRAFCSWAHLAMLQTQGIYGLFRNHQAQHLDFSEDRLDRQSTKKRQRKGLAAGRRVRLNRIEDQWVLMGKPQEQPAWLDDETWALLPADLMVRQMRVHVHPDGFKPLVFELVTTMLDINGAPSKESLAEVYLERWQIEVRLRDLKTTMQGAVLKCQSVEGVECEALLYLLACNLVTLAQLEEAQGLSISAHRVSFVDAQRWLQHRWWRGETWEPTLCPIALEQAGFTPRLILNRKRPGRQEPRVIKRRKDQYTYMTKPRHEYPESHTYRESKSEVRA